MHNKRVGFEWVLPEIACLFNSSSFWKGIKSCNKYGYVPYNRHLHDIDCKISNPPINMFFLSAEYYDQFPRMWKSEQCPQFTDWAANNCKQMLLLGIKVIQEAVKFIRGIVFQNKKDVALPSTNNRRVQRSLKPTCAVTKFTLSGGKERFRVWILSFYIHTTCSRKIFDMFYPYFYSLERNTH